MEKQYKITPEDLERVRTEAADSQEIARPALSYSRDVWYRFSKNPLSMVGLIIILLILFLAAFGMFLTPHTHFRQDLSMSNLPPMLTCYKRPDGQLLYVHKEYTLYEISPKGEVIKRYEVSSEDKATRTRTYTIDGAELVMDYSGAAKVAKAEKKGDYAKAASLERFTLYENGQKLTETTSKWNRTYVCGTDYLGRDMFARLIYGARISLLVALVATLVQFFIGVLYGGIAGYLGGWVDNLMMRIVDIISTVPLTLYVVLLMVVLQPGLKTIILALASVYWVDMARQVRGQILSIKNQEYVLAAKTIGASTGRIMRKHLVPNAMGAIIVSLTMSIPSAIFTESFLSFIGLGVSAPAASWGTLASDALGGLRTYPYQLFLPALLICVTVLGFNFLGDGLRDALDPKLRK
ncbi:MAG: ABC transporter permease [Clostridia bacterium]